MTDYENAVPTVYKGIQYRSRIEARWAVFFTVLGIEFEYEPQPFNLGKLGWYLPDFYIPKQHIWIEIKARDPKPIELKKLAGVVQERGELGLLLGGPCSWQGRVWAMFPNTHKADILHPVRLCPSAFVHGEPCGNELCLIWPEHDLATCLMCRINIQDDKGTIKKMASDERYTLMLGSLSGFDSYLEAWERAAITINYPNRHE
jgi:hypothetical protein